MKIKQQLAKRLASLKRIALWEGKLGRARLMKIHELSGIRASQWMREFRELNANILQWNAKTKAYLKENNLKLKIIVEARNLDEIKEILERKL